MNTRFISSPFDTTSKEELLRARPEKGDRVRIIGGTRIYLVLEAGMKYLNIQDPDTNEVLIVRKQDVVKEVT
jgi:hypothetical protein